MFTAIATIKNRAYKGAVVGALAATITLAIVLAMTLLVLVTDESSPGSSFGTIISIVLLIPMSVIAQPWFDFIASNEAATPSLARIFLGISIGVFTNLTIVGYLVGLVGKFREGSA